MTRLGFLVSIMFVCLGCSREEAIQMHGRLILAPPYTVAEFDLATGRHRVLLDTNYPIQTISSVANGRFLIGQARSSSKIVIYEVEPNRFVDLVSGERPHYVVKHQGFYYFSGSHLFFARLDDRANSTRTIAEVPSGYVHVIQVSDDEVVFQVRGDAGETPPVRYSLVSNALDQLPITRKCTPYVWRSASKQLLCGVDGTNDFFLIDLDGREISHVDFSAIPQGSRLPLLYLERFDVLILAVTEMVWVGPNAGEQRGLWAYSFRDGRVQRLLMGGAPGRGGIVWVEND